MKAQEQLNMMSDLQHRWGDVPWEMKVRAMAKTAVEEAWTFFGTGSRLPVAAAGRGIIDVRVKLIPELHRYPEIAQLVAEKIIHEQVPSS